MSAKESSEWSQPKNETMWAEIRKDNRVKFLKVFGAHISPQPALGARHRVTIFSVCLLWFQSCIGTIPFYPFMYRFYNVNVYFMIFYVTGI